MIPLQISKQIWMTFSSPKCRFKVKPVNCTGSPAMWGSKETKKPTDLPRHYWSSQKSPSTSSQNSEINTRRSTSTLSNSGRKDGMMRNRKTSPRHTTDGEEEHQADRQEEQGERNNDDQTAPGEKCFEALPASDGNWTGWQVQHSNTCGQEQTVKHWLLECEETAKLNHKLQQICQEKAGTADIPTVFTDPRCFDAIYNYAKEHNIQLWSVAVKNKPSAANVWCWVHGGEN